MKFGEKPLAVITGGSTGIGLELGREFARAGYDLVIGGQDEGKLAAAAAALRGEGAEVVTVAADLTRPEEVERFHREATASGRPVAIFCANAGVGMGGGDFTETDLHSELRLIDLNVRSQVHLTKLILPAMAARGEGRILFTASISSMMPGPFESVYSASKAFVHSFAEALRNEWADRGVVVTGFMPGPTDTNFFHRAGMDETPAGEGKKDDPAQVAHQAFKALMADRHHVFTGSLKTKVQGLVTNVLPSPALARVHRGMTEPNDRRAARSGGPGAAAIAGGIALAAVGVAAAVGVGRRSRALEEAE
ncbi:SDR family NAD(P)-dependent oxidoreductase [Sphingomonas parva]|nr:SDR family NAD(P)-dependent oxidoreductase [Sphingomonas parva]